MESCIACFALISPGLGQGHAVDLVSPVLSLGNVLDFVSFVLN